MRRSVVWVLCLTAAILLVNNLHTIFMVLPDEASQGMIYRILYFHIPAWWTAFLGAFLCLLASAAYLITRNLRYDAWAVSLAEVVVMYLSLGLVTGSIWARIIWGIWWTWDPRLTSALFCWMLYSGYLALRRGIDEIDTRARLAAIFSIVCFADVPIVYYSNQWWRTQHPQPMQLPPDMKAPLLWNWLAVGLLGAALVLVRLGQEHRMRRLDALRREAHRVTA
jgi:heme exporter protein C